MEEIIRTRDKNKKGERGRINESRLRLVEDGRVWRADGTCGLDVRRYTRSTGHVTDMIPRKSRNGASCVGCDIHFIRAVLTNSPSFDPSPTDFGLHRIRRQLLCIITCVAANHRYLI